MMNILIIVILTLSLHLMSFAGEVKIYIDDQKEFQISSVYFPENIEPQKPKEKIEEETYVNSENHTLLEDFSDEKFVTPEILPPN